MSADGVPVYLKQTTGQYQGPVIFKFVPPRVSASMGPQSMLFTVGQAGMFVWLTVPLDGNAHFQRILASSDGKSDAQPPEAKWTTEVWEKLAEARVLLTPGTYYTPWQGHEKAGQSDTPGLAFFRMSFSLMTVSASIIALDPHLTMRHDRGITWTKPSSAWKGCSERNGQPDRGLDEGHTLQQRNVARKP